MVGIHFFDPLIPNKSKANKIINKATAKDINPIIFGEGAKAVPINPTKPPKIKYAASLPPLNKVCTFSNCHLLTFGFTCFNLAVKVITKPPTTAIQEETEAIKPITKIDV